MRYTVKRYHAQLEGPIVWGGAYVRTERTGATYVAALDLADRINAETKFTTDGREIRTAVATVCAEPA